MRAHWINTFCRVEPLGNAFHGTCSAKVRRKGGYFRLKGERDKSTMSLWKTPRCFMGYEVCWAAWGLCTRTYIIHSVLEPLDLGLYQYSTWIQFRPKEYIKVRGQLFAQIFKIWAARRIASGKLWSGKYMVSKSCKLLLVCTMNVLVSVWAISTIYPFSSRLSPLVDISSLCM